MNTTSALPTQPAPDPALDLVIERVLRAPRAAVWRCWAEPELFVQWWCPKPWVTELRALELRPGGAFHTTMRGPDGGVSDNPGCVLEVVPGERLVTTSLLTGGWRPASAWMGMTALWTLADAPGGGTHYRAVAMHPDADACRRHAEMGFHEGWGVCAEQLDALACSLG